MMSGSRQGTEYAQPTRLAATYVYNFPEITMTTPPLTRILDRLIRGHAPAAIRVAIAFLAL